MRIGPSAQSERSDETVMFGSGAAGRPSPGGRTRCNRTPRAGRLRIREALSEVSVAQAPENSDRRTRRKTRPTNASRRRNTDSGSCARTVLTDTRTEGDRPVASRTDPHCPAYRTGNTKPTARPRRARPATSARLPVPGISASCGRKQSARQQEIGGNGPAKQKLRAAGGKTENDIPGLRAFLRSGNGDGRSHNTVGTRFTQVILRTIGRSGNGDEFFPLPRSRPGMSHRFPIARKLRRNEETGNRSRRRKPARGPAGREIATRRPPLPGTAGRQPDKTKKPTEQESHQKRKLRVR